MLKTTLFCAALVGTAVATKHAGVKRCTGALPHWQDYNPNWENAGCSFEAFCSTKPQSESEMRDRKACVEAEKAAMKGMASIEGLKAVLTAAGSASTKPDSDKAAWRVSVPGFKNTDTAVEKTYRKPKTPIPAAELYDINRGMVVFKSPAYMFNYMHVLEATLKTYGYEVVLFKNRFCNVGASGYRDMKIGLKKVGKFNGKKLEDIDWGEVAEVQFLIEPFATIKSHHKGKKDHGISDKEEKEKTSYLKKAVDYLKTETTIPTLTEAMHNGHIMYERSRAVADDNIKHLMPVFLQRLMNDFVDDNEFEITDRKENMVRLCSGAKAAHSFSTETFVEYGRKHPNSIYNKLMSFNLLEGKLKCEEKPMFQHKSGTKIQKQIEEAEEEARTCVGEKKKDTWTCLENFDKTLNIHFQAATDDSKDIHPEKANKAFLESFSKFVMNDSGFCHNNGGSSGVKLLRGNNN